MNVRSIVARSIAVAIVMLPLAACGDGEPEDAGVDTGVVYSSSGKYVKVHEDDGENDTHKVKASIRLRCSVGERWPDCKRN
jgi:hypothetical protein